MSAPFVMLKHEDTSHIQKFFFLSPLKFRQDAKKQTSKCFTDQRESLLVFQNILAELADTHKKACGISIVCSVSVHLTLAPISLDGVRVSGLWHLRWEAQFLSFEHFGNVQVEEVTVQDGLDDTSHNGNHVKESLEVETPDPVEEIKGTVHAQEEQIVGGDSLSLSSLANHEELGQDSHRLQVDGESPQDFQRRKVMVD